MWTLHTALTADARWIWRNDNNESDDAMVCTKKQMMDIGGMETIFVAMGKSRGKYIEN